MQPERHVLCRSYVGNEGTYTASGYFALYIAAIAAKKLYFLLFIWCNALDKLDEANGKKVSHYKYKTKQKNANKWKQTLCESNDRIKSSINNNNSTKATSNNE